MRSLALMCSALLLGCATAPPPPPAPAAAPPSPAADSPSSNVETKVPDENTTGPVSCARDYGDASRRILEAASKSDRAWRRLTHLTDRIGHRLSGSKSLERAVAWAKSELAADGHENVRTEKVMVPHWVRGAESASIVAPTPHEMRVLGLGGTVGGTVTGEVVVVRTFEELDALGGAVKGKIVLFDKVMPPFGPNGHQYGETVVFRNTGPAKAAELGASAALVRSVTATSLRSPHTGATRSGKRKIPAASITVEDAELIKRLVASGETVEVKLSLGARTLPDAESANVLAELRGKEKPDEIVVIGAHLDSWDVGQGAHDDGSGCVTMMEALALLRELGLGPRRTIRVVLFTNEENGLRGAFEYAKAHAEEKHVAALESDTGGFAPQGFRVMGNEKSLEQTRIIASLLEPLGATKVEKGFSGADIMPLARAGVNTLGLQVDTSRYFDFHHSEADTLDKVNPADIRADVGAVAVMAYVLADMPATFGK